MASMTIPKLEERPNMMQLCKIMREQHITTKWFELGLELLENSGYLEVIKADCHSVQSRCQQMFQRWLEIKPDASWSELLTALRSIEMTTAADAISKQFEKNEASSSKSEKKSDVPERQLRKRKSQSSNPKSCLDDEKTTASTSKPKRKRKATASGSSDHGSVLAQKVEMFKLIKIVIPKVKADWQNLAYAMKYNIGEVDAFDKEGRDLQERCKKLFTNWVTTGHGPTPKTYETLLKYIKEVDELTAAREEIEKELIKALSG